MIHVSRSRAIRQVQYLIHQSIQGNHVLFGADELKRAIDSTDPRNPLSEEELYALEPVLERLLDEPTLEAKRAFLEALEKDTYERVIQIYLNVVENSLLEAQTSRESLH